MSMEAIREKYGVPAKRNMRVIWFGRGEAEHGTITGTVPGTLNLRVMLDGASRSTMVHPSDAIKYVVEDKPKRVHRKRSLAERVYGPRGPYDKNARKDQDRNAYMLEMGLALVMMQEQELDENGRRQQSAEDPDWRAVERFVDSHAA